MSHPAEPVGDGETLPSIMLKRQKDRNPSGINARLKAAGFWKKAPPEGSGHAGLRCHWHRRWPWMWF